MFRRIFPGSPVKRVVALVVILGAAVESFGAQNVYTIFTFKNGQRLGARVVKPIELRNAAVGMTTAFREAKPSYAVLLDVAKSMTAKDRCFNLFSSRIALASASSGLLDVSANAEEFLKNSVASIEEVNGQTQVACEMR